MMHLYQNDEFYYHDQSDKLLSNWQMLIKVMNFYLSDDISSGGIFIKVLNFHQYTES